MNAVVISERQVHPLSEYLRSLEFFGKKNLGQWTHFEGEEPGHWNDSSLNEQVVLGKESEAKARELSRTFSSV